jgi:hypothetical protein
MSEKPYAQCKSFIRISKSVEQAVFFFVNTYVKNWVKFSVFEKMCLDSALLFDPAEFDSDISFEKQYAEIEISFDGEFHKRVKSLISLDKKTIIYRKV